MLLLTMMSVACWTRELEAEAPVKASMEIDGDVAQRRRSPSQNLGSPGAVSRSRFYDQVRISKNWNLSFTITPTGTVSGWSNILHITDNDSNSGWGSRIPAVFFHSNSRRLHVCMSCDGNSNFCLNPSMELPLNEETFVWIETWGGEFTVGMRNTVGGTLNQDRAEGTCDAPYEPSWGETQSSRNSGSTWSQTPPTASLYTSNPWHTAAPATLKNIKYYHFGDVFGLERGMVVTDQLETAQAFTLSFRIQPYRVLPDQSNVLRITESGSYGYGSRIPGVWFDERSTRLRVCTYCTGNTSAQACVQTAELPFYKDTVVTVEVSPGANANSPHWFTVTIDNEDVPGGKSVATNCYDPYIPTKQARMYQSGPWFPSAEAFLYDVVYTPSASGRRLEEPDARLQDPSVVVIPPSLVIPPPARGRTYTDTHEELAVPRPLSARLSPATGDADLSGAENGGGL